MEEKTEKEIELNNLEIVTHISDSKHLLSQPSFREKFVQVISPKRKGNRHFGNNLVFFFIKGEPLCTIGPHCINIFLNVT